jgi:hypothetical protein
VVGFVWSDDAESYVGGIVATGRVSHARKFNGDDPDKRKKRYPGPPGSGSGLRQTISSFKNVFVKTTSSKIPHM